MPSNLRIGVLQYAISEHPEENLDIIKRLAVEVAEFQPDLVVLPEVCLTGFGLGAKAPSFTEDCSEVQELAELARTLNIRLLAGVRSQEGNDKYNRALLFDSTGICFRYDKQALFSYWNEHKLFRAGSSSKTFTIEDWTVAPFICYELRFPELFRRAMGAELMLVIANWPSERRHHWLTLLRARAIENQCYVVGVNRVGTSRGVQFVGDSIVYDPYGATLVELGNEQGVFTQDLDLEVVRSYRKKFPVLGDALLLPQQ